MYEGVASRIAKTLLGALEYLGKMNVNEMKNKISIPRKKNLMGWSLQFEMETVNEERGHTINLEGQHKLIYGIYRVRI